jgi:hypothetical protein
MDIVINITIATLFGTASGGVVFFLSKNYLLERIKGHIKNEYDSKLENLRGEIGKNNMVISSVLSSQNQGYQIGHQERILAVKELWTNYVLIRESLGSIHIWDSVLLENELNTLYSPDWTGNNVVENSLGLVSQDIISDPLETSKKKIENLRPFLNEHLWALIVFFVAFNSRIIYLYTTNREKRIFRHWKSDTYLVSLVKDILTVEEFNLIQNSNSKTIISVQNFIEQKVLFEISKIVTGQAAADNTYKQALLLMELNKKP